MVCDTFPKPSPPTPDAVTVPTFPSKARALKEPANAPAVGKSFTPLTLKTKSRKVVFVPSESPSVTVAVPFKLSGVATVRVRTSPTPPSVGAGASARFELLTTVSVRPAAAVSMSVTLNVIVCGSASSSASKTLLPPLNTGASFTGETPSRMFRLTDIPSPSVTVTVIVTSPF